MKDSDEDRLKDLAFPALWLPPANSPIPAGGIRLYNANGNFLGANPIYDYPDDVYLDMPGLGGAGVVSVNDIRLTSHAF